MLQLLFFSVILQIFFGYDNIQLHFFQLHNTNADM